MNWLTCMAVLCVVEVSIAYNTNPGWRDLPGIRKAEKSDIMANKGCPLPKGSGCTCFTVAGQRGVKCEGKSVVKIPSTANLPVLDILVMNNTNLRRLNARSFKHTRAREIIIEGANLGHRVEPGAFDSLGKYLTSLRVINSNLRSLPLDSFSNLIKLRQVTIQGNKNLRTLPAKVFSSLKQLEYLFLENNGFTQLPDGVFKGLKNVQFLSLSKNRLRSLKGNIFSGLGSVRELFIDSNKIHDIDPLVWDSLPGLFTLSMQGNKLRKIQASDFRLPSVFWLDLSDNRISTLKPCAFSELQRSAGINLAGNPVKCDCALQWLREDKGVWTLGTCQYPVLVRGEKLTDFRLKCDSLPSDFFSKKCEASNSLR